MEDGRLEQTFEYIEIVELRLPLAKDQITEQVTGEVTLPVTQPVTQPVSEQVSEQVAGEVTGKVAGEVTGEVQKFLKNTAYAYEPLRSSDRSQPERTSKLQGSLFEAGSGFRTCGNDNP